MPHGGVHGARPPPRGDRRRYRAAGGAGGDVLPRVAAAVAGIPSRPPRTALACRGRRAAPRGRRRGRLPLPLRRVPATAGWCCCPPLGGTAARSCAREPCRLLVGTRSPAAFPMAAVVWEAVAVAAAEVAAVGGVAPCCSPRAPGAAAGLLGGASRAAPSAPPPAAATVATGETSRTRPRAAAAFTAAGLLPRRLWRRRPLVSPLSTPPSPRLPFRPPRRLRVATLRPLPRPTATVRPTLHPVPVVAGAVATWARPVTAAAASGPTRGPAARTSQPY